jgi:hypothetical protein
MIQIAKVTMNNILAIIIITIATFLIYYILAKIKEVKIFNFNDTLIYRKVQLNE